MTDEERRAMMRNNYAAQMEMLGYDASGNPLDMVHVVRCRDCKYYVVKDHWGNFYGVPVLAASDVPTCYKWSDGCMTKPDGYCFIGERRDGEEHAN